MCPEGANSGMRHALFGLIAVPAPLRGQAAGWAGAGR